MTVQDDYPAIAGRPMNLRIVAAVAVLVIVPTLAMCDVIDLDEQSHVDQVEEGGEP